MRKIVQLIHVSLDGMAAGPAGELDWIVVDDDIQAHVEGLLRRVDTALYGRVTYQMMEGYWPTVATNPASTQHEIEHAHWVENVQKVVFSRSLDTVAWHNTTLVNDHITEAVSRLKQQPGGDLMIFGSPVLAQVFMQLDLIDEFRINVNPIVLGKGIPFFPHTRMNLKLLSSKVFPSGVLALHYEVAK
jgi:dihydrofolate reductase